MARHQPHQLRGQLGSVRRGVGALVGSIERRVYSPTQAEQDTAAIAQAYAASGRVNAGSWPRHHPAGWGHVDLVFQVNEGGVTEVERISFVGNREFSERRLRNVLETRQAGSCARSSKATPLRPSGSSSTDSS
jgi:outer membrane protein assembly factor BamA